MINNEYIDNILNEIDIVKLISADVNLKRSGNDYVGLCPFHNEKTPSFIVSPSKNIFKCFGCGEGGNSISYIMKRDNISFVQAVRILGQFVGLPLEEKEFTESQKIEFLEKETIYNVLKWASNLYFTNLKDVNNESINKYALSRWNEESICTNQIGYAEKDYMAFIQEAVKVGFTVEQLKKSGLVSDRDNRNFLVFSDRLMIPLKDKFGRIIAFTGRDMSGSRSKYKNSPETLIFKKGNFLFGYDLARNEIRKTKTVFIVEGNADCIKLNSINITNVVATCGTGFTSSHLESLKDVETFKIIGDSDNAGDKAIIKTCKTIVDAGKHVTVIPLPKHFEKGERIKTDPDSFFTSKDQFNKYLENEIEFIFYYYNIEIEKSTTPIDRGLVIDNICSLLLKYSENIQEEYLKKLAQISKISGINLNQWKATLKRIKACNQEKQININSEDLLPQGINREIYFKYGFYEQNNCYYFKSKDGTYRGSNFVIKPISHIESILNSKRVYEIKNEFGYNRIVEMNQEDLVSLSRFRQRVESLGNFIFTAEFPQLMILKSFLYENTISCQEVTQLGWHKKGFFAWGNGVSYNGNFTGVDKYGIVQINTGNFYLPAFSNIYADEPGLFQYERKFIYDPKEIKFCDLFDKMKEVFGDNAIVGIAFTLTTIFKDIVVKTTKLPILNLFGPKGSGKSKLAYVLLQFFGHLSEGNNINNTSRPALADDVSRVSNALVHIEEYKNMIEPEKIEFLKGLWDGRGRTRMNMDKDKKSETTATDSGIILSGQEMPTADIALYSRLIALTFTTAERSEFARRKFDELMKIASDGYSHLTHYILQLRPIIEDGFLKEFKHLTEELTKLLSGTIIEDRIFFNWVTIFSVFNLLKTHLQINITDNQVLEILLMKMKAQNNEVAQGNEISIFWRIVEYLYSDEKIKELYDFKLDSVTEIKTDVTELKFKEPKHILFIQHSRIFQLYREYGKKSGENILPLNSLEYYLKNSKEYYGKIGAVRFRAPENITDPNLSNDGVDNTMAGYKRYKITTALAFDYDRLGIHIDSQMSIN